MRDRNTERPKLDRIIACRSDIDADGLAGITVLGADRFAGELRANGKTNDEAKRRDLIAAIRNGEHVELLVDAVTFRQKEGVANRKFTRHADGALEDLAASFEGMPVLLDHNKFEQAARIGTIESSSLARHGGTGWASLNQKLRIVKPDAVISVLDGTIDRFSIGWHPTGPVLCSVHGTDVRGSADACYCWPGDSVTVDGKTRTVEYVFTASDGIEVSAVNVPAVTGTRVDDIRTALALELDIAPRFSEPARSMQLARLIAVLGVSSLATPADEERAVQAYEDQKRARLAAEQERDQARTTLEAERAAHAVTRHELATERETGSIARARSLIDAAYSAGKLVHRRDGEGKALPSVLEGVLLDAAKKPNGLADLEATLAAMPVVVPIGKREAKDDDKQPERAPTLAADVGDAQLDAHLQALAAKTGQDINTLRAEALRRRQKGV